MIAIEVHHAATGLLAALLCTVHENAAEVSFGGVGET